jgi:hypothetical protein
MAQGCDLRCLEWCHCGLGHSPLAAGVRAGVRSFGCSPRWLTCFPGAGPLQLQVSRLAQCSAPAQWEGEGSNSPAVPGPPSSRARRGGGSPAGGASKRVDLVENDVRAPRGEHASLFSTPREKDASLFGTSPQCTHHLSPANLCCSSRTRVTRLTPCCTTGSRGGQSGRMRGPVPRSSRCVPNARKCARAGARCASATPRA